MSTSKEVSALVKDLICFDEDTPTCEPCSLVGDHLPAYCFCFDCQEHLCQKCSKYHVLQKAMRTHKLLTMDDKKKASSKGLTDKCSFKCNKHRNKKVEYYCEEHSFLGCTACITIKHKQCSEPVYIPTAAADVTNQADYKQFNKTLKSLENACKAEIDDVEKFLKQIEADESQVKIVFKDFRGRLNKALNELENEVTTKAKEIKQEESRKLESLSKELDKSLCKVITLTKKVDSLLNSGQCCDLYITIKQEENQLVHLSGELDAITRDRSCQRFEFRPNNDVLKPGALGTLSCIVSTQVPALNRQDGQTKPAEPQPTTTTMKTESISHDLPSLAISATRPKDIDCEDMAMKTKPASVDRPSPATPATSSQDKELEDMARRMKMGVRVRRGRDWIQNRYDNKDGWGLGTVIREGVVPGVWWVRWDLGEADHYRMGGDCGDYYDLQIVEGES